MPSRLFDSYSGPKYFGVSLIVGLCFQALFPPWSKETKGEFVWLACPAGPNTPVVGDAEEGTAKKVVLDVLVVNGATGAPLNGTHVKLIDTGGTYDER